MSIPERKDIIELSRISPVVRSAVIHWRNGAITWEQAMMLAVIELDILRKATTQYQIELEGQHETIRE